MNIIVTGCTGMVGGDAIRLAADSSFINRVTAIGRKAPDISSPKIKFIKHENFLDYTGMEDIFKCHDAILWCLGISQIKTKSEEEYHLITHDFTLAAANAINKINPSMTFVFVSGMGADRKETSPVLFARIKGKTENSLLRTGLRIHILRPGGIQPVRPNHHASWPERMLHHVIPLLRLFLPGMFIRSGDIAKAMMQIIQNKPAPATFSNADLIKLAEAHDGRNTMNKDSALDKTKNVA